MPVNNHAENLCRIFESLSDNEVRQSGFNFVINNGMLLNYIQCASDLEAFLKCNVLSEAQRTQILDVATRKFNILFFNAEDLSGLSGLLSHPELIKYYTCILNMIPNTFRFKAWMNSIPQLKDLLKFYKPEELVVYSVTHIQREKIWKAALFLKLDNYMSLREKGADHLTVLFSKISCGYSKKEKIDAIKQLQMINGFEVSEKERKELDRKDLSTLLKILQNGSLGKIIRDWEKESGITLKSLLGMDLISSVGIEKAIQSLCAQEHLFEIKL